MQTKPPAQTFRDVGCALLSITERHIEAYADAATAVIPDAGAPTLACEIFVGELYQPFFGGARFFCAILSETPMFVAF